MPALALFTFHPVFPKDPYPVNRNLDILHYRFHLALSDSTDHIKGKSEITLRLTGNSRSFELDLVGVKPDGTGMKVKNVGPAAIVESFQQTSDRLRITFKDRVTMPGTITVEYEGVPADGLVIGKNKYGNRGFFGDNWPDRGHYWLACVDHPSDKATVEFLVTAPEHYSVVATGKLMETSVLPDRRKLTHWSETAPVPVKVMTIGVTRFAVRYHGLVDETELSTWVYPEDRDAGFADFACADSIFRFFREWIGPYSFAKLAHVQSKTRWGGLENAGAIFYSEKAVTGKRKIESLVAHESAHQWFGDAATENDWHHVWLSEGFATYFAHRYNEYAHGEAARGRAMDKDRQNIFRSPLNNTSPVVDTTITDINNVLSIITYQKAAWVLHMLRREIGEDAFQKAIRSYYARYRDRNALTADLRREVEQAAGRDLGWFFNQWIFRAGTPQLEVKWTFDSKRKEVKIRIRQTNQQPFRLNLEIGVGNRLESVVLQDRETIFTFSSEEKPAQITLDPAINLLFQGKLEYGKL